MIFQNYFKFLYIIDLFGKQPNLYYKEKPKRKALIGVFSSILYISIYITYFIYKINKMLKRVDYKFSETNVNTEGIRSINITNEKLFFYFSLMDVYTRKEFIDETIYYPIAYYFRYDETEDVYYSKYLEVERCTLEKSKYKDLLGNSLTNYYCIKNLNNLNEILEVEDSSSASYSYIYLEFHPCINGIKRFDNKDITCKDLNIVEPYINENQLFLKFMDIEYTPQNYDSPVNFLRKDLFLPASLNLYYQYQINLQITNIETDKNIIGIGKNIKKDLYLKYKDSSAFSFGNSNEYVLGEGGEFFDVNFCLTSNVFTYKRTYTNFIDVLGEVGGFMSTIYSLIYTISFFFLDISYEISLVNNLFDFNESKKIIIIKSLKNKVLNDSINNQIPKSKYFSPIISPKISSNRILLNINNNKNLKKENFIQNNPVISLNSRNSRNNKCYYNNKNFETNDNTTSKKNINTIGNEIFNFKSPVNNDKNQSNSIYFRYLKDINLEESKIKNDNVNEINLNIFYAYLCTLCIKKNKNFQKNIFDAGMKIIRSKLDIINLFKISYSYDINSKS